MSQTVVLGMVALSMVPVYLALRANSQGELTNERLRQSALQVAMGLLTTYLIAFEGVFGILDDPGFSPVVGTSMVAVAAVCFAGWIYLGWTSLAITDDGGTDGDDSTDEGTTAADEVAGDGEPTAADEEAADGETTAPEVDPGSAAAVESDTDETGSGDQVDTT